VFENYFDGALVAGPVALKAFVFSLAASWAATAVLIQIIDVTLRKSKQDATATVLP
jgi:hypothetical protein